MNSAWEVNNNDINEYQAVVVFCETESQAAIQGASEMLAQPEDVRVSRKPLFDQFAEQGWVPARVLFENRWLFSCTFCDRRLDDDDEDFDPVEPQFHDEKAFCSEYCLNRWMSAKRQLAEEIAKVCGELKAKFPTIRIETVCGSWGIIHPIRVKFRFPEGKYSVVWESNKPTEFQISKIDIPAWRDYVKICLNEPEKSLDSP